MLTRRLPLLAALCLAAAWAVPAAAQTEPDSETPEALDTQPVAEPVDHVRLELALFPVMLEQQIEGPSIDRDDRVTRDIGVSTQISATWIAHPNFEVGALFQLDAGRVLRAKHAPADQAGNAPQTDLVEGAWWELWTVLLLRGRLGPAFVELGWAPLILRQDDVRDDLPNALGETDGLFQGSRAVAWLFGAGAEIELIEDLYLTARLQFRIRYLVSRGGEPLMHDQEFGQMALSPFIGISYAL